MAVARQVRNFIEHEWFTLALLASIVVAGALTRAALGDDLPPRVLRELGFAPADAFGAGIVRSLTSALVTESAKAFWVALVAIAGLSGYIEWRWGHVSALLAFWGSHIVTLVIAGIVLIPMAYSNASLAHILYVARDVGPSAGYVGCLGWLLSRQKAHWGILAMTIAVAALGVMLVRVVPSWRAEPLEVSAALAHLIAVPAGLVVGLVLKTSSPRPPSKHSLAA